MIIKRFFGCGENYTKQGWGYFNTSRKYSRLIYVLDGEAYYEENGKITGLKKGYLYIIPSKTTYSLYENPENKLMHRHVQIYTLPQITDFAEIEVTEDTVLYDAVSLWGKHIHNENEELIISILQLVLSCLKTQLVGENQIARGVKRYIDGIENFNVNMKKLCEVFGYTREYITRIFTAAYRITPIQYISSKKMLQAQRYIKEGKSVKESAYLLGYSSPYSFSNAYKKYYGHSPRLYLNTQK